MLVPDSDTKSVRYASPSVPPPFGWFGIIDYLGMSNEVGSMDHWGPIRIVSGLACAALRFQTLRLNDQ